MGIFKNIKKRREEEEYLQKKLQVYANAAVEMMIAKGMREALDDKTFMALCQDMMHRIEYECVRACIAQLPENKMEVCEKNIDSASTQEELYQRTFQLFTEAGIDVQRTEKEVIKEFREAYLKG